MFIIYVYYLLLPIMYKRYDIHVIKYMKIVFINDLFILFIFIL